MSRTKYYIIIPILLVLFSIGGCTKKNNDVVLKVSEFELSKETFSKSYNTAPSILKFSSNPKSNYAAIIIDEYIISQYLIAQGYGRDSSLSKTMRLFQQELIVEKVFKEDIDNKIIISYDEIKSEILKGKKQVKVKYIYSRNYNEALELRTELSKGSSFEELQEIKLLKLGLSTDAGETGFINYGEVNGKINDVIFSLPANKTSDIIKTDAGYFILKVVDVRRTILSESDITRLSPTYKKILYNKRLYAESRKYLKDFLDPKGIVVDGKVFKKFVNALYPIYKSSIKTENLNFEENQEFFKVDNYEMSEEFLSEKMITYNGGFFTVKELLYHLSYYPVSFPTTSIDDFANSLKSKIGLRLRDIFLEEEGLKRGYDDDSVIKEEMDLWKNQINTYRYLQRLSEEIKLDTVEVKKTYDKKFKSDVPFSKVQHKYLSSYKDYLLYKKLKNIIEQEKNKFEISINSELLKGLNLPKVENNFGVDLYSYKMGLPYSRLAFAVPNRIWAAENVWNSILRSN